MPNQPGPLQPVCQDVSTLLHGRNQNIRGTYIALLVLKEKFPSMGRNKHPGISRAVVCGLAYAKHEIPNITSALIYTVYFAAKRQPIGINEVIAFTILDAKAFFTEAG